MRRILIALFIFLIGYFLAILLWNNIHLPFSNPWGITGPLTVIKFNPMNNIVRYLVVVTLPSILLFIVFLTRMRKFIFDIKFAGYVEDVRMGSGRKSKPIFYILFILLLVLSVSWGLNMTLTNYPMDTFHEGETLGPAIMWQNNKVLYKDIFFVHGVFEDPLRSVLAFNIFGKSIGAMRVLTNYLIVFAYLLFGLSLFVIFKFDIYLSLFSFLILFLLGNKMRLFWIPHRDMTLYSFLILSVGCFYYLKRENIPNKNMVFCLLFLCSLMPFVSFAYSVDRGFYILAAFIVSLMLLYPLFFNKRGERIIYILSIMGGTAVGIFISNLFLRGAFPDFFKVVFFEIPRYKELMDGFVYPIPIRGKYAIPISMQSSMFFFLTHRFLQSCQQTKDLKTKTLSFIREHYVEIVLLTTSIFFFRSGLGRCDWPHIQYSSAPIYILFAYLFIKYPITSLIGMNAFIKKTWKPLLSLSLILLFSFLSWKIVKDNIIYDNFVQLHRLPDEFFIPSNYKRAISFLKGNLKRDEYFFTMTSEGSWYYFVNKLSPTRFLVVWFAMPYFYQKEVVNDLEKHDVKYVIYRNNLSDIDGFSPEQRLPIICSYLKKHYRFLITIDDNEIWIKHGN